MKRIATSICLFLGVLPLSHAQSVDLEDGLIGYWPLNGDALDFSTTGNHGALLTGASWIPKPDGQGQVLQTTIRRDGNDDPIPHEGYVEIDATNITPAYGTSGYVEGGSIWVWFDDTTRANPNQYPFQDVLGNCPGIHVLRTQLSRRDIMCAFIRKENGSTVAWPSYSTSSGVLNLQDWHHIAWNVTTSDNPNVAMLEIYLDGALVKSVTGESFHTRSNSSNPLGIGSTTNYYSSNLKIAEFRLYDRHLTIDEIDVLSDETTFLAADAPISLAETVTPAAGDVINPASLLAFVDSSGTPLPSSLIPGDVNYAIYSGPVVIDENGNLVFVGGGEAVVGIEVNTGNNHIPAGSYTATMSATGDTFNNALWDDSTGTGYYIIKEDMEAAVATYSMEAMRIDSDGNVGIGTSEPTANLHVSGDILAESAIRGNGGIILNEGTANEIILGADGSVKIPKQGDIEMGAFSAPPAP